MRTVLGFTLTLALVAGAVAPGLAANLKDKVTVAVKHETLEAGMEPGAYVCAAGHLHVAATVQNHAGVPLGRITVAGKALGADGTVLGTATASTTARVLAPGQSADVDLEFVTVQGPLIKQVKKHELAVVDAPAAAR